MSNVQLDRIHVVRELLKYIPCYGANTSNIPNCLAFEVLMSLKRGGIDNPWELIGFKIQGMKGLFDLFVLDTSTRRSRLLT
jgi:hypothetical protein